MSHLNVQDLLRCRLVAKKWEEESTIQLLSNQQKRKLSENDFFEIGFFWEDKQLKFENTVGNLEEFTESFYGNPLRKYPCSQFFIRDIPAVDDIKSVPADLFNFLSKYGQHITSLDLHSKSNSASVLEIFRKIIFEWTPNLKLLFFSLPFTKKEDELPRQNIQHQSESNNELQFSFSTLCLKNLEALSIKDDDIDREARGLRVPERCKKFVSNILSLAPNLQRISDWDMLLMGEIISSGKACAVTDVFCSTEPDKMPLLAELYRARPKLRNLGVELENFLGGEEIQIGLFLSSLQLVLESSSTTMKYLTLCNRLHFDFNKFESRNIEIQDLQLNIPVMTNLENLKICWETFTGGAGWLLPIGLSFQVLFPKLKKLTFHRIYNVEATYEAEVADNPFANSFNSSTTVERLYIKPEMIFDPEWIPQARALYPNVRILHLKIQDIWDEIPEVCISIWNSWNQSSLEELKITGDCLSRYPEQEGNFAEIMDQAFTGFDIETCRMLRKRKSSNYPPFKRGSSILDMNKLKLLKIGDKTSDGFPLFSRVSVIHAFDPMRKRQNLQVFVNGVHLEEMIQERNVDFPGRSK